MKKNVHTSKSVSENFIDGWTQNESWQYFIHEKLVSNIHGASLSLKSPSFFMSFKAIEQHTKVLMKLLG